MPNRALDADGGFTGAEFQPVTPALGSTNRSRGQRHDLPITYHDTGQSLDTVILSGREGPSDLLRGSDLILTLGGKTV